MIRRHLLAALAATLLPLAASAATFTINYTDGAGEGFNDPTLGTARKAALQYCADVWGRRLQGTQNIVVQATFDPLGGSGSSAVLGQAGTHFLWRDFSGAPVASTFYVDALANQLFGGDLDVTYDIGCTYNSDVDGAVVLGSTSFYYGLNQTAVPSSDISFCRVAFHEFGHGLGFAGNVSSTTGAWNSGFPTAYSSMMREGATAAGNFTGYSNGQRLTAITGGNLNTFAPLVVAAHSGVAPLYAPNPYQSGSSVSHYNQGGYSPAELMEPVITNNLLTFGLTDEMMQDMGWGIQGPAGSIPTLNGPAFLQFNESAGAQNLSFTLSAATTVAVDGSLLIGGTAIQGTDYTISTTTLHFDAGTTTQNIVVTPIADGIAEGNETITLKLYGILGAQFGQDTTLQINASSDVEGWNKY